MIKIKDKIKRYVKYYEDLTFLGDLPEGTRQFFLN